VGRSAERRCRRARRPESGLVTHRGRLRARVVRELCRGLSTAVRASSHRHNNEAGVDWSRRGRAATRRHYRGRRSQRRAPSPRRRAEAAAGRALERSGVAHKRGRHRRYRGRGSAASQRRSGRSARRASRRVTGAHLGSDRWTRYSDPGRRTPVRQGCPRVAGPAGERRRRGRALPAAAALAPAGCSAIPSSTWPRYGRRVRPRATRRASPSSSWPTTSATSRASSRSPRASGCSTAGSPRRSSFTACPIRRARRRTRLPRPRRMAAILSAASARGPGYATTATPPSRICRHVRNTESSMRHRHRQSMVTSAPRPPGRCRHRTHRPPDGVVVQFYMTSAAGCRRRPRRR
jgi:hypothetical protein